MISGIEYKQTLYYAVFFRLLSCFGRAAFIYYYFGTKLSYDQVSEQTNITKPLLFFLSFNLYLTRMLS